jgi:hypothetical protein
MAASRFDLLTYHAAGHAAVAYSFGHRLNSVRIDASTYDGLTTLAQQVRPTRLQYVLILLAGGRAEAELDHASSSRSYAAVEDEYRLQAFLEASFAQKLLMRSTDYNDRLTERVDERLAQCCRRLVVLHWQAIQRLAGELSQRHELSGLDAETILGGRSPSR